MDKLNDQRCRELLVSIRKIIQAIDIYSRNLNKSYGLTGPQLIVLQEIAKNHQISVTPLSRLTSLSQATVTDITKRLENKGYILREKRSDDKRAVYLSLSEKGQDIMKKLPPLLQKTFTDGFSKLENWEQLMILSGFERVVHLMSAQEIDASPIMATGAIVDNPS